jgi:hypothetical protein
MSVILLVVLGLLGVFLAIIMVLFLLVGRNLKAMAAAVAHATSLAEKVEEQAGPPLVKAAPKRSMKEIFSVLPSLLRRADTLRKN